MKAQTGTDAVSSDLLRLARKVKERVDNVSAEITKVNEIMADDTLLNKAGGEAEFSNRIDVLSNSMKGQMKHFNKAVGAYNKVYNIAYEINGQTGVNKATSKIKAQLNGEWDAENFEKRMTKIAETAGYAVIDLWNLQNRTKRIIDRIAERPFKHWTYQDPEMPRLDLPWLPTVPDAQLPPEIEFLSKTGCLLVQLSLAIHHKCKLLEEGLEKVAITMINDKTLFDRWFPSRVLDETRYMKSVLKEQHQDLADDLYMHKWEYNRWVEIQGKGQMDRLIESLEKGLEKSCGPEKLDDEIGDTLAKAVIAMNALKQLSKKAVRMIMATGKKQLPPPDERMEVMREMKRKLDNKETLEDLEKFSLYECAGYIMKMY